MLTQITDFLNTLPVIINLGIQILVGITIGILLSTIIK